MFASISKLHSALTSEQQIGYESSFLLSFCLVLCLNILFHLSGAKLYIPVELNMHPNNFRVQIDQTVCLK